MYSKSLWVVDVYMGTICFYSFLSVVFAFFCYVTLHYILGTALKNSLFKIIWGWRYPPERICFGQDMGAPKVWDHFSPNTLYQGNSYQYFAILVSATPPLKFLKDVF